MKFFEYNSKNNAPYYALVASDSAEEANSTYEKDVCELDTDFYGTIEVTEACAREAFSKGKKDDESAPDLSFDEAIEDAPCVLLVDGCSA